MKGVTAAHARSAELQFFPPNHSVGRAEYQQPCIPYEDTGVNKVGFWSGFFPLDKILPTVSDTQDTQRKHIALLSPVDSHQHRT